MSDYPAPDISNRRVWVGRLPPIGEANAGPPYRCTDPLRFIRYLRYATYVLAIAIAAAVVSTSVYGAAQRPEEGQASGFYDRTGPESVEHLEAHPRGLFQTTAL